MSGYVDIHAHILPGIDDGPESVQDAIAMAQAAIDAGTTTLASTPHLRSDFPDVHVRELADRCNAVRERVAGHGLALDIVCAAEASLIWALDADDEEIKLASYGQRGTDLLIETPTSNTIGLERMLYELRVRGFRITLAHPERTRAFQSDPSPLHGLVDEGILLQVNADSLLGDERRSATCRLGADLCRAGLVHAVASDGHRAESWRPVSRLAAAAAAAAELVGPDRARWMMTDAPAAVVSGAELPPPPAVVSRSRWKRLWGRG
jgi:protein-tyrosine phosphatase